MKCTILLPALFILLTSCAHGPRAESIGQLQPYPVPPGMNKGLRKPASSMSCADFAKDADLNAVREMIKKDSELPRIVEGYNLHDEMVVYTSMARAAWCAVVEKGGKVLHSGAIDRPVYLANEVYSFLMTEREPLWEEQFNPHEQLGDIMKKHGVRYALVLNVDNTYSGDFAASGKNVMAGVAFHEGFHLFYQPIALARNVRNPWPKWNALDFANFNTFVAGSCYKKNERVQALAKAEVKALNSALELASSGKMAESKKKIAAFFDARDGRYAELEKESVRPDGKLPCETYETHMEMIEGFTRYVEIASLGRLFALDSDLLVKQYFEYFDGDGDLYYVTGMLQMLLLRAIHGDGKFPMVQKEILASDSMKHSMTGKLRDFAAAR